MVFFLELFHIRAILLIQTVPIFLDGGQVRSGKANGKTARLINSVAFKAKVENSSSACYPAFHSPCFVFLFSANGLELNNKNPL